MISNDADSLAGPEAGPPRRRRVAALLAAATPRAVATVALAAAPLVVTFPLAAPSGASATLHADLCNAAVPFGGLDTLKWPLCAGD